MFSKIAPFATAAALSTLVAASMTTPVHAAALANAALANGLQMNGLTFNGVSPNAAITNGLTFNGRNLQGTATGSTGVVIDGIELPAALQ